MAWRDDWPVIGSAPDGDGKGEPVLSYEKPNVGHTYPATAPQAGDEFDNAELGLQWQWNTNPRPIWESLIVRRGFLRLTSQPAPAMRDDLSPAPHSLYGAPNFLMQKFPAPDFIVTTELGFWSHSEGETAGLAVFGYDYALLGLRRTAAGHRIVLIVNSNADKPGAEEHEAAGVDAKEGPVYLRVTVTKSGNDAWCRFAYSFDNQSFTRMGEPFKASVDRWIGAKVGLIATAAPTATMTGYADFDWFRVSPSVQ